MISKYIKANFDPYLDLPTFSLQIKSFSFYTLQKSKYI